MLMYSFPLLVLTYSLLIPSQTTELCFQPLLGRSKGRIQKTESLPGKLGCWNISLSAFLRVKWKPCSGSVIVNMVGMLSWDKTWN